MFQNKYISLYLSKPLMIGNEIKNIHFNHNLLINISFDIRRAIKSTGTNHNAKSSHPLLHDKLAKLKELIINMHNAE